MARKTQGLFLTVFLGFAAGVLTVIQAFFLADIIDGAFLRHETLTDLRDPMFFLLLSLLLRSTLAGAERYSSRRLALGLSGSFKAAIVRHLARVSVLDLENEQAGEIQAGLSEGIEALRSWLGDYLPQVLLSAIVPLTVLIFVFPRDLLSALILLVTAPLIPLFMVLIGQAAEKKATRKFEALRRMGGRFLDIIHGLGTLKLLGRSRDYIKSVRRISSDLRVTTMGVLRQAFLSALALELLSTLSTAVVAVEVGLRLLYGHMEFRDAFLVVLLAPEFYLPLRMLGQRFHAGIEGVAAAERLYALLELPEEAPPPRMPLRMPAHPRLECMGLSAVYQRRGAEGSSRALERIDLVLDVGKTIAVAGPSGAGKTSLARVLLRFLQPTEGRLLADGIPSEDIPLEDWWSRISWVGQEASLISGSIEENLRIARPSASRKELEEAADSALILPFIESLPQSWDTPVGEGGARLSGGQAHRMTLARAFVREAPILILDEPGEGLDPPALEVLSEATRRLLENRSALVIAHRLETLARADELLYLEEGRITHRGRPEALLAGPLQHLRSSGGGVG